MTEAPETHPDTRVQQLHALVDGTPSPRSWSGSRGRIHLAYEPEQVGRILQGREFARTPLMAQLAGNGMIWSDGDDWRDHRRLAQPIFHERVMHRYLGAFNWGVDGLVARLEELAAVGAPFALHDELIRFTIRVLYRSMFNRELPVDHDKGDLLLSFFDMVGEVSWSLLYGAMGTPLSRSIVKCRDLRALVDREIETILESGLSTPDREEEDFIGIFLGQVPEAGIKDEILTIFLAGAETTSNLLAWMILLLANEPDEERVVREELQAMPPDASIDLPMLEGLPRLHAAVRETLRLYPPIWMIGREVVERTSIDDHSVDPGDWTLAFIYYLHRNPMLWDQPDRFVPGRFLEEPEGPCRHAYAPFGGGRHLCLGKHFAEYESLMAAATILRRFRFDLAVPRERSLRASVGLTLRPDGTMVRVRTS